GRSRLHVRPSLCLLSYRLLYDWIGPDCRSILYLLPLRYVRLPCHGSLFPCLWLLGSRFRLCYQACWCSHHLLCRHLWLPYRASVSAKVDELDLLYFWFGLIVLVAYGQRIWALRSYLRTRVIGSFRTKLHRPEVSNLRAGRL